MFLAEHTDKSGKIPAEMSKLAVKLMLPEFAGADMNDFLGEALVMREFNHPNILSLVGLCTAAKPWAIVVEFMQYKDLGVVLRSCRRSEVFLRPHEMCHLAAQVATGMIYLGELRYLHRDIAARNILLTTNNVVKIGDFGLARKLPDGESFWKLDKAGKLPVKYMALESLTTKRFTVATDVWSFGVFIWEIMACVLTCGGGP